MAIERVDIGGQGGPIGKARAGAGVTAKQRVLEGAEAAGLVAQIKQIGRLWAAARRREQQAAPVEAAAGMKQSDVEVAFATAQKLGDAQPGGFTRREWKQRERAPIGPARDDDHRLQSARPPDRLEPGGDKIVILIGADSGGFAKGDPVLARVGKTVEHH